MILDSRQKEIVRKAISDYDFIREELENQIDPEVNNLERLIIFLNRFKGIEITNFGDNTDDEQYLDFNYNDVNMFVMWNNEDRTRVGTTLEIWDNIKKEYVVEDWLNRNKYVEMTTRTKEEDLALLVQQMKYCESKGLADYSHWEKETLNFLKENW